MAIRVALDGEAVNQPNAAIDETIEQLPLQDALQFLSDLIVLCDEMHAQISAINLRTHNIDAFGSESHHNGQRKELLLGRLMRYQKLQKKTMLRCQVAEQQQRE